MLPLSDFTGIHAALIMDGNGRWATARGKARTAGHLAGAETVRRIVEAAPGLGIGTLTLYAFSADNWQRPPREVAALMRLLQTYLRQEASRCVENGVRLTVIGRRDRLSPALVRAIERAEAATSGSTRLHLRIAVDYSARDSILRASALSGGAAADKGGFKRFLAEACNEPFVAPDVDLLVRTGGEQRLSDFLLWECAYAEFVFSSVMWPDFTAADLAEALTVFRARDRRFGKAPVAIATVRLGRATARKA